MRLATLTDIDSIIKIVKSNSEMYGANIVGYHDSIIQSFKNIINDDADEYERYAYCYELDNIVVGVIVQLFWEDIPFWTATQHFVDSTIWKNKTLTTNKKICSDMIHFLINDSESKGYYDCVSVVRGESLEGRYRHMPEKFRMQYNHNIWKIIDPYEMVDNKFYSKLLGHTHGKNTKPLMIRHSSMKPEYR